MKDYLFCCFFCGILVGKQPWETYIFAAIAMVEIPFETRPIHEPVILRDSAGKFLKGVSPNPYGKPPGVKNQPNLGGPLTNEIMEKIETFSKPELLKLIRKVGGAIWGVGIMSDDEAFEAVRLKLLHTGLTSESANSSLNVLKEWADRTKGKPAQSIAMKIETNPLEKMSTERLVRLEQTVSKMLGQDAVVIPPMPELLGDDD